MASSTLAPQVFGADEINAVVLDPGSYTTKCGFAGYDSPSVVLPSYFAQVGSRRLYDENSLYSTPISGEKILPLVQNDMVVDWDAALEQYQYMFKQMDVDPAEQPLLLTESTMNSYKNKVAALETFLEKGQFCAFYSVKQPTCASFAHGRPNCLVVDIGHDLVTATPVVDGLCLRRQVRRTRYAGRYVDQQIKQILKERKIEYHPIYTVQSKTPVYWGEEEDDGKNKVTKKPEYVSKKLDYSVDKSVAEFNYTRTLQEMKETLLECSMENEQEAEDLEYFELPDGLNVPFDRKTRLQLANSLFNPAEAAVPSVPGWEKPENGHIQDTLGTAGDTTSKDYVPLRRSKKADPLHSAAGKAARAKFNEQVKQKGLGISRLTQTVLDNLDVDLRPQLANNIILTGATSLVPRLNERLHAEMTARNPSMKIRIHSVGNTTERKYSSWIGGSILASLGTFHQLWVSQAEYAEEGADRLIVNRFR